MKKCPKCGYEEWKIPIVKSTVKIVDHRIYEGTGHQELYLKVILPLPEDC